MHRMLLEFERFAELEDELKGEESGYVKESMFGFFEKKEPQPLNPGILPPITLPTSGDDDEDDEDAPDEEFTAFRPSNFKFIQRPVGLEGAEGVKEKDLILRWRQTKDDKDLEAIYAQNNDFLKGQVRGLSSYRLPGPAIEGMVYNKFRSALSKWDPDGGANIQTFFKSHYRQNLNRDAKALAQFGRSPRRVLSKVERVRKIAEQLEFENNYVPTAEEIVRAANPGEITVGDVKDVLAMDRGDLLGSKKIDAEDEGDIEKATMMAVRRVRDYYGIQKQKAIDHIFGINGAEHIKNNAQLAKKFGISGPQMSMLKQQFRQDIRSELQNMGVI